MRQRGCQFRCVVCNKWRRSSRPVGEEWDSMSFHEFWRKSAVICRCRRVECDLQWGYRSLRVGEVQWNSVQPGAKCRTLHCGVYYWMSPSALWKSCLLSSRLLNNLSNSVLFMSRLLSVTSGMLSPVETFPDVPVHPLRILPLWFSMGVGTD